MQDSRTKFPASSRFEQFLQLISRPHMLAIMLFGFSSGLPLALSGTTLQAWYTTAGVSMVGIGALTLVSWPYTLKFLWAPLFDRFQLPFFDRRRGWVCLTQIILAIILASMAFFNPQLNPWGLGFLAFCLALVSSCQDINLDAYRTDSLAPEERGLGSAYFVGMYRIAMLVSGGIAMMLGGLIGWHWAYLVMAILMLMNVPTTFLAPKPQFMGKKPVSLRQAIIEPFKEFLQRPAAISIVLFLVIYKLGDVFALSLGTAFLIKGLGFSVVDVGAIYKSVGMLATIVGALLGGVFMLRFSLYSALMYFGILQAVSNVMFVILAIVGKSYVWMVMAIFVESFCGGLATAAFLAFLMALCDHRFTATQFALLSALSAIGRVFIGPFAGLIQEQVGWVQFFLYSVLIALPGLFMLYFLKKRIKLIR